MERGVNEGQIFFRSFILLVINPLQQQQQQRLMMGTKQAVTSLSSSPLYVVRPQSSPVPVRNSTQQPYVSIISGGRLQQSTPALSRPTQQSTYYVSSGTNSPVCYTYPFALFQYTRNCYNTFLPFDYYNASFRTTVFSLILSTQQLLIKILLFHPIYISYC